jgi:hypothetical protein
LPESRSRDRVAKFRELCAVSASLAGSECGELQRFADRRARQWSAKLASGGPLNAFHNALQRVDKLYSGGDGPAVVSAVDRDAFAAAVDGLAELEPPLVRSQGDDDAPTPLVVRAMLEPLAARFVYHHRRGGSGGGGDTVDVGADFEKQYRQISATVRRWVRSHAGLLAAVQSAVPPGVNTRACFAAGVLALVAEHAARDLAALVAAPETAKTVVAVCEVARGCANVDAAVAAETGSVGGPGSWAGLERDPNTLEHWLRCEEAVLTSRLNAITADASAWVWSVSVDALAFADTVG